MTGSRDAILGALRQRLRGGAAPRSDAAERLATPKVNLIPERGQRTGKARVDQFVEMADFASATVARVASEDEAVKEIARYLRQENLPADLVAAPGLTGWPWRKAPLLQTRFGRAQGSDLVGVAPAFAAIAETGTLMMLSGPESPTTVNFLPDTHVVALRTSQIVGSYEAAWSRLRAAREGKMPRTVNFITGPSRSADIEQTLLMGAHGPRRLHIVLIEDGAPSDA
jgi:L-lactate dehydrogenase complex protein LldG